MASVLIRTVLIYGFLALAMKLMGKRQLGELETGELISALLISEIAALPIDNPDIPLSSAIFPTLLIITLEILISFVKNKSNRLKRAVDGEPTFIIYKGRLRQDVLRENRISINEVLSELRVMGVGDITDTDYVILEQNGKLSVLQKNRDKMAHALIIDGEVNQATLKSLGYNLEWLNKRLAEQNCKADELFLFTVGDDGVINIIKEEK